MRETASERKGEATAPAIASERATAFLALVLMARIISKIFRAGKWLRESMEHRRAQMLRRKTRRSGRSGQSVTCEEHAQGNGETPVRVMRHQARTRREGGIPPTKHRDANGGCSAREESSFSPKGATSMRRLSPAPEGALRGLLRRRQRGGTRENETSRAGLRPEDIYVYVEHIP